MWQSLGDFDFFISHTYPWYLQKVALKDTEGFDWLESTEHAIDKRKFLLNRLYEKQPIPQDQD